MIVSVLILMVVSTAAIPTAPCYFWPGSTYVNGKCFALIDSYLSWSEAEEYCDRKFGGGILAEPRYDDERDALGEMLNASPYYWIGGSDTVQEGIFVWKSTSQPVEIPESWWMEFEPNNWENSEDCLAIHSKTFFLDVKCAGPHTFVCEYSVDNPCDYFLPGGEFIEDKCLLFVNESMTAADAQNYCLSKESFLADGAPQHVQTFRKRLAEFYENSIPMTVAANLVDRSGLSDIIWLSRNSDSTLNGQDTSRGRFVCERDIGDPCEVQFPGGAYSSGFCFKLFESRKNWEDAETFCKSHSGYLMEPDTKELSDALDRYLLSLNVSSAFLGGRRNLNDGIFYWKHSGKTVNEGYTKWYDGEPNNQHGVEESVAWTKWPHASFWNDLDGNYANVFVCQQEANYVTSREFVVIFPTLATSGGQGLLDITTVIRSHPVYLQITKMDGETYHMNVSSSRSLQFSLDNNMLMSSAGVDQNFLTVHSSHHVTVVMMIKHALSVSSTVVYPNTFLQYNNGRNSYFVPSPSGNQEKDDFLSLLAVTSVNNGITNVSLYQMSQEPGGSIGISLYGMTYLARDQMMINTLLSQAYTTMLSTSHFGINGAFLEAKNGVSVIIGRRQDDASRPRDHSLEQLSPVGFAGKEYITFPSFPLDADKLDTFRIIAMEENVNITIHEGSPRAIFLESPGAVVDVSLPRSGFYHVSGNERFYLIKYSGGAEFQSCITTLYCWRLWQYQISFSLEKKDFYGGHDIYLVVIAGNFDSFRSNDDDLKFSNCMKVEGPAVLWGCYYQLKRISFLYQLYTVNFHISFMAYLYGTNENSTFCHPIGYPETPKLSKYDPTSYLDVFWSTNYADECVTTSLPTQENPTDEYFTSSTPLSTTNTKASESATSVNLTKITPPITTTAHDMTRMNLTSQEASEIAKAIEESLHVDARETSAYRRSKISVEDERVSSTVIGVGGIIFVSSVASLFLLFDLCCRGKGVYKK